MDLSPPERSDGGLCPEVGRVLGLGARSRTANLRSHCRLATPACKVGDGWLEDEVHERVKEGLRIPRGLRWDGQCPDTGTSGQDSPQGSSGSSPGKPLEFLPSLGIL